MSVKVQQVTKLYGAQKALDEVSFEVKPGQVTGFLGPNGAGKSTMMKILTCYLPQSSGDAEVAGFDVTTHSIEVRRCVGYLPEHNPLYLDMYVKEFLQFIGGIQLGRSAAVKRTKEMIELTGLGAEQHKKIGQLSKGYRQRVGLAQALIHDPKVLILDEPTTGLDPNQLMEIRSLIREIGRQKTVIFSTHIMQEVEAVCDRAIIIHKGKIVADESTRLLREKSTGKQTVVVEFDKEVAEARLREIEGVTAVRLQRANVYRIESATGNDIRPALFRFAVDQNVTVITLTREEHNLESVFRSLTVEK